MMAFLKMTGSVKPAARKPVRLVLAAASVMALAGLPAIAADIPGQAPPEPAAVVNDYPTIARVDYVIACMASNGNTREVARKCSCSIDAIAAEFPYDKYVTMETARIMQDLPGERASMMRGINWIKDLLEEFRQIQVAADLRCF